MATHLHLVPKLQMTIWRRGTTSLRRTSLFLLHTNVIYCPKGHTNEKSYTSAHLCLHSVHRNNFTCTWTLVLCAQSSIPLYQNNNERGITHTLFIQGESWEDERRGKTPLGLQFLCSPSTGNADCRHGRGMLL